MTVFEDQWRAMKQSGLKLGSFDEEMVDVYGWAVERNFKLLASSNSTAEALIGCVAVIRAAIGLMAAMGFTTDQMQEQWELINQMAPSTMVKDVTTVVEALMLNQGVPVVPR